MRDRTKRLQRELLQAEKVWGPLATSAIASFSSLVSAYDLSVASGDNVMNYPTELRTA